MQTSIPTPAHTPGATFSLPPPRPPVRWHPVRRYLATLGSLGAATALYVEVPLEHVWPLWLPVVGLVLSGYLAHARHTGAQMLARAFWWANLVLGTIIATCASRSNETEMGLLMALCCGTSLLALGGRGLSEEDETGDFRPGRFRGLLTCAVVMALADAQALTMWGLIQVLEMGSGSSEMAGRLPLALPAGVLMGVALVGLYRLRTWGVLLNLGGNLSIAALALMDIIHLPEPIVAGLVFTAAIQLLLPIPLLRVIFAGRVPVTTGRLARASYWAPAALVSALMGLAVWGASTSGSLLPFS